MDPRLLRIQDVKLMADGTVAVEFTDGQVRTFTAQQLYDASRTMGQAASSDVKSAAQRRAEEMLASRRGRR